MATHPSVAAPRNSDAEGPNSPIENEIPTYRAISPLALASAGMGLASAMCFVSWSWAWLALAALAVITGVLAIRNIAKRPDALTGRSFAQAGIAMGLVFAITSQAYGYWQTSVLYSDARAIATKFNETLNSVQKTNPVETSDVVWYMIPPAARRGITPEDAKAQLSKVLENSEKVKTFDDSFRSMIAHAGGVPIEFVKVENAVYIDLDAYASVLLKVGDDHKHEHEHKPGEAHDHSAEPEGMDHALVVFKGSGSRANPNRWYVENITYPYVPDTYTPTPAKAAGDHGHGH